MRCKAVLCSAKSWQVSPEGRPPRVRLARELLIRGRTALRHLARALSSVMYVENRAVVFHCYYPLFCLKSEYGRFILTIRKVGF